MPPLTRLAAAAALAAAALTPPGEAPAGDAKPHALRFDSAALDWGGCPAFMPEGCRIAVAAGDPAEPNADIFFRVPGGARIPRHWHRSPERIVMLKGEMAVDYDGAEPVVLTEGSYAYGPRRLPHSATCRSEEACVLFIGFVEPVDAIAGAPD